MFVRRLLVCAVLASLAACAAPTSTFVVDKNPNLKQRTSIGSVDALDYQLMPKRSSAAFSSTVSTQDANNTALCLQQHLSSEFKLPPEFVSHKVYTDNNHSVGLINPFTKVEGITMDVVNKGSSSEIKLYDNGNLLSRAWKQLPSKCGQGKTTTLAQETGSGKKTKTAAPAQSGVDFIAASKAENKPTVALAASTPAVIKAAPAIKATPARIIQDSTPAIPLQAAQAVSTSPSSAFNAHNTAPVLATAAKESSMNTPVARSSFTQETPDPINFVARTDAASPTEPARWDRGDLTQDDMSIIAPATAAVVTPAMAIAAKSMASYDNNNANTIKASGNRAATSNKPTTTSKAAESSKPKASSKKPAENQEKATNNRGKTTTANASNSKQTAKDKTSNSRNKADDNKINSKSSRTKATEKADKAENTKNSRTKNSKAAAAEEKNSSKAKNSRNKAQDKDDNKTSKGKKTNERNVKADKNDDNNKSNNKKASAKNNDSGKNNKKTTQERDNSSKAKASGNKSKATDKKAESAKKAPKKDKAK